MWMRARRFTVMIRLVRVALGKTKRASSAGIPASNQVAVEPERPLRRLLKSRAYCLIGFSDRTRQHRGRLLEGDVALRLLIKRHTGAMSHQLVAERSGHTGDGEGEDDVLNGAPVSRLNDAVHELPLLGGIDLASNGAAVDLFWWKF